MDEQFPLTRLENDLRSLCQHISQREDEKGPFLFAVGLKRFHSLEARILRDVYSVELWEGPDGADQAKERLEFHSGDDALACCTSWLTQV